MTKRTVQQGLASYRDVNGVMRHALQGTEVDVHRDYLADFDKANGGEPAAKKSTPSTPVKKAAPAKKAAPKRR